MLVVAQILLCSFPCSVQFDQAARNDVLSGGVVVAACTGTGMPFRLQLKLESSDGEVHTVEVGVRWIACSAWLSSCGCKCALQVVQFFNARQLNVPCCWYYCPHLVALLPHLPLCCSTPTLVAVKFGPNLLSLLLSSLLPSLHLSPSLPLPCYFPTDLCRFIFNDVQGQEWEPHSDVVLTLVAQGERAGLQAMDMLGALVS